MTEPNEVIPEESQDENRELTPEELAEISAGSGTAKRNGYNSSQQPWQTTIEPGNSSSPSDPSAP